MGIYAITGNAAVDSILKSGTQEAYDGGCYRGISEAEFAGLQSSVANLSAADRAVFDQALPAWLSDRDGSYAVVIEALKAGQSYDQFAARMARSPAPEIERPLSCEPIS